MRGDVPIRAMQRGGVRLLRTCRLKPNPGFLARDTRLAEEWMAAMAGVPQDPAAIEAAAGAVAAAAAAALAAAAFARRAATLAGFEAATAAKKAAHSAQRRAGPEGVGAQQRLASAPVTFAGARGVGGGPVGDETAAGGEEGGGGGGDSDGADDDGGGGGEKRVKKARAWRRGTVLLGALPAAVGSVVFSSVKAARKAKKALALPEVTAQKVETGGSTSLSVQELQGMVPKAKGATKIALQASLLSCGTVHQLKDVLRAEGLPKCHSSKKLEVSNVLREHWGMRRW
jgi:hypothetical protein